MWLLHGLIFKIPKRTKLVVHHHYSHEREAFIQSFIHESISCGKKCFCCSYNDRYYLVNKFDWSVRILPDFRLSNPRCIQKLRLPHLVVFNQAKSILLATTCKYKRKNFSVYLPLNQCQCARCKFVITIEGRSCYHIDHVAMNNKAVIWSVIQGVICSFFQKLQWLITALVQWLIVVRCVNSDRMLTQSRYQASNIQVLLLLLLSLLLATLKSANTNRK